MTEKLTRTFALGVERITDSLGRLHNSPGPAVVNTRNGHKEWYTHGILTRDDDQPAVVGENYQAWYLNGKLHRGGDKPAFIKDNGIHQEWWQNGKRHRDPQLGPAVLTKSLKPGFSDDELYFEHGVSVPKPTFLSHAGFERGILEPVKVEPGFEFEVATVPEIKLVEEVVPFDPIATEPQVVLQDLPKENVKVEPPAETLPDKVESAEDDEPKVRRKRRTKEEIKAESTK
jgi:hypothetical protein